MLKFPEPKDPDAELDFTLDWSNWLPTDDSILTSEWVIAAPDPQPAPPEKALEIVNQSNVARKTTVWLRGGLDGQNYHLLCRIETEGGRKDERTVLLRVKSR